MALVEICNRNVVTIEPDDTLLEAAQIMKKENVGSLVVKETVSSKPMGLITDRDIVSTAVANEIDARQLLVKDVMTRSVVVAKSTDGVYETLKLMRQEGIRRIPVVQPNGKLCGIVSFDDLLDLLSAELRIMAEVAKNQSSRPKTTGRKSLLKVNGRISKKLKKETARLS